MSDRPNVSVLPRDPFANGEHETPVENLRVVAKHALEAKAAAEESSNAARLAVTAAQEARDYSQRGLETQLKTLDRVETLFNLLVGTDHRGTAIRKLNGGEIGKLRRLILLRSNPWLEWFKGAAIGVLTVAAVVIAWKLVAG